MKMTDVLSRKITVHGGMRYDLDTYRRMENPLYMENYGYKVYSQNDEDGIIQEIFRRIGTTNRIFIEFGVQNGLECNSHYLLFKGWRGLWIEGSEKYVKQIRRLFRSVLVSRNLKVVNAFITKDNINDLFVSNGYKGEIDLLSIDIDGNDYHIFECIEAVQPRVIIVEFNAKFPPDCEWVMQYDAQHQWDGSDKQGASLKSLELLAFKKGYQLVGTNISGVNAFFVRRDLAQELFPLPATAENLYNPLRSNIKFYSGHPSTRCILESDIVNKPISQGKHKLFKLFTGWKGLVWHYIWQHLS